MKYKIRWDLRHPSKNLYRIEALKDFSNVKKGDIGGWIEKEANLSQYDDCWIYDNAMVFGDARVYHNAVVYDDAKVFDNAKVYLEGKVYQNARVYDRAVVKNAAEVYGNAVVCDDVTIFNSARVHQEAKIFNKAQIYGEASVSGNALVQGIARIFGEAKVFGRAEVRDAATITAQTFIYGDVVIRGSAQIMTNVDINSNNDYWTIKASGRHMTFYKTKDNGIAVTIGCQEGIDLDRFEKLCYKDGLGEEYKELPKHRQEYLAFIELARKFLGGEK